MVTSDVVFPARVGAECGAVQKRLPAPEGEEPVQTEGAERGKDLDSGLGFHACVMYLPSLLLINVHALLCGPFEQECRKCPKQVASGSHE